MSECPEKAQVVIIGSGIIGAAIAYYLTRKGISDVFVLEQGEIGFQGATSACLGGLRTQFSTAVNIRLSLISRKVYQRFKEEFGVDPGFKPYGYLFLTTTDKQWEIFENTSRLMTELNLPIELLVPQKVSQRWPSIRVDDLSGGHRFVSGTSKFYLRCGFFRPRIPARASSRHDRCRTHRKRQT